MQLSPQEHKMIVDMLGAIDSTKRVILKHSELLEKSRELLQHLIDEDPDHTEETSKALPISASSTHQQNVDEAWVPADDDWSLEAIEARFAKNMR